MINYLSNIMEELVRMKNGGKIVVACCGCFDVFHIGHLHYLRDSKCAGDILVVGINSDESYKRIKGKLPMFSATDRFEVINSLNFVDFVFVFKDNTFCNSLEQLHPNIFSVGTDKIGVIMPEQKICEKYGIKFIYSGKDKTTSSSIIKRDFFGYESYCKQSMHDADNYEGIKNDF